MNERTLTRVPFVRALDRSSASVFGAPARLSTSTSPAALEWSSSLRVDPAILSSLRAEAKLEQTKIISAL